MAYLSHANLTKNMKSLERRFDKIQRENPLYSSYTSFAVAVTNGGFSRETISRWFHNLVEKEDYAVKEEGQIMKHLVSIT